MKNLLFATLIVSSLVACKNSTETKPAFDLANAKKEIEAANKNLMDVIAKGDSVGTAAAYSPDGAVMFNNMPSVNGTENLIKVWSSFINAGIRNIELTTVEVWGDENFLTEEGTFIIKSNEGAELDKGKYLVLWKKVDGKWKLHRDISNSELPAVPAAK